MQNLVDSYDHVSYSYLFRSMQEGIYIVRRLPQ